MARDQNNNRAAVATLIERPNQLKQKVGSGGIDPAALRAAEAAIADLAVNYLDWARLDLDLLQKAADAAARDPKRRAAHIAALFDIAHNVKGQGSTFGYPLLTRVANSLCRYIEYARQAGPVDFALIYAHLDALRAIILNQIAGAGGDVGQALASELEAAAARRKTPSGTGG